MVNIIEKDIEKELLSQDSEKTRVFNNNIKNAFNSYCCINDLNFEEHETLRKFINFIVK